MAGTGSPGTANGISFDASSANPSAKIYNNLISVPDTYAGTSMGIV